MTRRFVVLLLFVILGLSCFLGTTGKHPGQEEPTSAGHTPSGDGSTESGDPPPELDSGESTPITMSDRRETLVQQTPEGFASHSDAPASTQSLITPGGITGEVLNVEWIDPPEKTGRRRVRILRTDFKYPHLRVEERVWQGEAPGQETVEPLIASVADHLIVIPQEGRNVEETTDLLEDQGFRVRASGDSTHLLVEVPNYGEIGAQQESILAIQEFSGFVDIAEPDYLVFPCLESNDPAYLDARQYALENTGQLGDKSRDADIDAPEAWDLRTSASLSDRLVVVAVVDSGIRVGHEDLAGNLWHDPDTGVPGFDFYDDDLDLSDPSGHGTHCAGTIGARGNNGVGIAGVAWQVELMALRFLGATGGATSDAIRAIDFARTRGVDIINASWGGRGESQALEAAILRCHDAGIAFVAAAGNNRRDTDAEPHFPSGFRLPNVVSVAATDDRDQLSHFSNFGRHSVDLAAPGSEILSCDSTADGAYKYLSGTSMAAPFVSGALALARAEFPEDTVEDLLLRLRSSVNPLPQLESLVGTGGRLNLHHLLADSRPALELDDLSGAWRLVGCSDYFIGTNDRATREAGEDDYSPDTGNRSMWFAWTAPTDGSVIVAGRGSAGDISLVAFEGDEANSLRRLADNFAERPVKASILSFTVSAGREYRISIDSRQEDAQLMLCEIGFASANDQRSQAFPLLGDEFSDRAYACGASEEFFEREPPFDEVGDGRSLWWRWTSDFDGPFLLSTRGTASDTVLAVYESTPAGFQRVAFNDDSTPFDRSSQVEFEARSGGDYLIEVDAYDRGGVGAFEIHGTRETGLTLLTKPEDVRLPLGRGARFEVLAVGSGTLNFRWFRDGIALSVPNHQDHLALPPLRASDYGTYRVEVSNYRKTISWEWNVAPLAIPPYVTNDLHDRIVTAGGPLRLAPRVAGAPELEYQWYKDGTAIPGATLSEWSIAAASSADEGSYHLEISNDFGSTSTRPSRVTVQDGESLRWTQRLPDPTLLDYSEGLSWKGRIYLLTTWNTGAFVVSGPSLDQLDLGGPIGLLTRSLRVHGEHLVATGTRESVPNSAGIAVSSDGTDWTLVDTEGLDVPHIPDFASNGEQAIACAGGMLYRSSDLATWQVISGLTNSDYQEVEWTGGVFMARRSGPSGSPYKLGWARSTDGTNWTEHIFDVPSGFSRPSRLESANGLFFSGEFVSADGIEWSAGGEALKSYEAQHVVHLDGFYYNQRGDRSADGFAWELGAYRDDLPLSGTLMFVHNDRLIRYSGDLRYLTEGADFGIVPETNPRPYLGWTLRALGGRLFQRRSSLMETSSSDGVLWQSTDFRSDSQRVGLRVDLAQHDGEDFWAVSIGESIGGGREWLYRGAEPGSMELVGRPPEADWQTAFTMLAAGNNGVSLSDATRFWTSSDEGRTWRHVEDLPGVPGIARTMRTSSGFVAAYGDRAWVSTNSGGDWTVESLALSGRRAPPEIADSAVEADRVALLDGGGYLHISRDAGRSWETHDLGETGWAGCAFHRNGLYLLHVDGRVAAWQDAQSTLVLDSRLPFPTPDGQVDLESFRGALFAIGQGVLLQAGEVDGEAPSIQTSGVAEGAVYHAGALVPIQWKAEGTNPVTSVRVYLNGELLVDRPGASGTLQVRMPDGGQHTLEVMAETSLGLVSIARRSFTTESRPMQRVTSRNPDHWIGAEVLGSTLYVAMEDGRLLRSADGIDWELARDFPAPPQVMLSTENALVVATVRMIYSTRDGITWAQHSLNELWQEWIARNGRIHQISGRVSGETFHLQANNSYYVSSEDGLVWTQRDDWSRTSYDAILSGNTMIDLSYQQTVYPSGRHPEAISDVLNNPSQLRMTGNEAGFLARYGGSSERAPSTTVRWSSDGLNWHPVETNSNSIPWVGSGVYGLGIQRDDLSPAYLYSVDGLEWKEAARLPQRIHHGIWWSGNEYSHDGLEWFLADDDGRSDDQVIGFLGETRVVSRPSGNAPDADQIHLILPTGERYVADLAAEFAGENPAPDVSDGTSFVDAEGRIHLFWSDAGVRYSRWQEGTGWSEVVHSPDGVIPMIYHNGEFYHYRSTRQSMGTRDWEVTIQRSVDGVNWVTSVADLGENLWHGYAPSKLRIIQGTMYLMANTQVYRSFDQGATWSVIYVPATNQHQPDAIVDLDGILFVHAQDGSKNWIFRFDPSTSSWSEIADVPLARFEPLTAQGGRLHLISGQNGVDQRNLSGEWTRSAISWGTIEDIKESASQLVLNSQHTVFTTSADGTWHANPGTNKITHVAGEQGWMVQHRDQQMWMNIGHDLSLEIGQTGTDGDFGVNKTIEVALEIRNPQNTDITTGSGSRITLWALPAGLLDLATRIPAGSVDIDAISVPAGDVHPLTAAIRLPNETPPGPYFIAARLEASGEFGQRDHRPGNNWAKAPEGFELVGRRLELESAGEGRVERSDNSLIYANGAFVSLSANPGKGAAFAGWSGDAFAGESEITLQMNDDRTVSAAFTPLAPVRVTTRGGGLVVGLPLDGGLPLGTTTMLTAQPEPGWRFVGWSGDLSGLENPASLIVDGAKSLTALFELPVSGWQSIHFSESQQADEAISGPEMDPDRDGLANWKEYLHGSDPMHSGSRGVLQSGWDGGSFRVLFTRTSQVETGYSLISEGSRDLSSWSDEILETRIIEDRSGIEVIEARIRPSEDGAGFLRFHFDGNTLPSELSR